MRILPADQEGSLEEALNIIRQGGIVAHPTETCYGFACDLTNPDAKARLSLLKKRPKNQPVSALFASIDEAKKWVEWNDKAEELAKKYLPGPLTIILPSRCQVSDIRYQETLGVRVSSHPVAQRLAELCEVPLSTTSANLHGYPEPYSAEEIFEQFQEQDLQPDLILDAGVLPRTPPSTIVDLTEGTPKILRQGSTVIYC